MISSSLRLSRKRLIGGMVALTGFTTLFAAARLFGLTISIPGISEDIIRSVAHFCVFGTLAFLTAKFLGNMYIAAWLIGVIIATFEEVHQLFVPYRYCSLQDWLIDVGGISTFLILGYLFEQPLRRYMRKKIWQWRERKSIAQAAAAS